MRSHSAIVRFSRHWAPLAACLLAPSAASAHENSLGGGFVAGVTHPVFGWDHLLAMVSVGVVSARLGGRNIWIVPAAFVGAMIAGGVLGLAGVPVPYSELGIALSVVFLGLGIVFARKQARAWWTLLFVAFFGVFHGHAHGREIPDAASPAAYVMGFVLSTTALHIAGVLIGEVAERRRYLLTGLRWAGAVSACVGLVIVGRWIEWTVMVAGS